MSLYDLPQLPPDKPLEEERPMSRSAKERFLKSPFAAVVFVLLGFAGGIGVTLPLYYKVLPALQRLQENIPATTTERIIEKEYVPQTTQEEKVIEVVKKVSPAVVSIAITKDVPVFEQFFQDIGPFEIPQLRQKGTEKQETGRGSGFLVSADGTVVTNKHVVVDQNAEYTVFTTSGKSYKAKVLARDPVQDVAILKITQDQKFDAKGNLSLQPFPYVSLGNSSQLEIGQSVIAIGNALGEFRNTVSVGVISGLGRTITAAAGGFMETIYDVIQTDAAINQGNSGGPLLNLAGEVIGVNTATVLNAQNIGFAVPVRAVVKDLEQVKTFGKISAPFIGVRYAMIDEKVKSEENLPVDNGAFISKGKTGEPAITPKSPAEKAGLQEGDIILELNGEKITLDNTLAKVVQKYNPGDLVPLKILRNGKELTLSLTLGSRSE